MIDTENIVGVYTLTNPYAGLEPVYIGNFARCKFRYNTPVKAAKAKKKAKAKKRTSKQSRKRNR